MGGFERASGVMVDDLTDPVHPQRRPWAITGLDIAGPDGMPPAPTAGLGGNRDIFGGAFPSRAGAARVRPSDGRADR